MTPEPTTDVALFDFALTREMAEYAELIAPALLLPPAYRNRPADLLIAAQLGMQVGIAPAQAWQEIAVINGRPTLSAKLMSALVRRAGHKLRVEGDEQTCTATLTRHDDPDNPVSRTWTIEMATRAGLTGKDNWRHYPADMLSARCISAVARWGAAECLLGIDMSTEEARDMVVEGEVVPKRGGLDAVRAAVAPASSAPPAGDGQPVVVDTVTGEVVDAAPVGDPPAMVSDVQRRQIVAGWGAAGITSDPRTSDGKAERGEYIRRVIGRDVASAAALTFAEAEQVIGALEQDAAAASEAQDDDGGESAGAGE